ncbi:MAG: hypothetical protein KBC81_00555 [Candidatus Pacebacteria bacterium]|nr:hypothetical protein [Candidatus Paceibacterota bacterium]
MTREEFALMIHWHQFIWLAGVINVGAMLPQLIKIVRTKDVAAISPGMFWLYMILQLSFSVEGFFTHNDMFMWCMGLSAFVSLVILIAYRKYRPRA